MDEKVLNSSIYKYFNRTFEVFFFHVWCVFASDCIKSSFYSISFAQNDLRKITDTQTHARIFFRYTKEQKYLLEPRVGEKKTKWSTEQEFLFSKRFTII